MKQRNAIYLDHAAGTFVLPGVVQMLQSSLGGQLANPSSIHSQGRATAAELDGARRSIARTLGCKPSEIIFTSGGTEANNLALRGLSQASPGRGNHIISCATEHPSVLETLKDLEEQGFKVTYLPTDPAGQIDLATLEEAITPETILITLMWVNNETGLKHPLSDVAAIARRHKLLFHCDGVQALGHLPVAVQENSVDSMSFSGHKMGTPAGIGVLFLRKGTALSPQHRGGSQENSQRGGTQNTLGALAFATALDYHHEHLAAHSELFSRLKEHLIHCLNDINGVQLNTTGQDYVNHILSCSIPDVDGEALFIRLDMLGMAVSNGSACTSGSQTPSHVLKTMGFDKQLAQATIRISLGLQTTEEELDRFCAVLDQIINELKRES